MHHRYRRVLILMLAIVGLCILLRCLLPSHRLRLSVEPYQWS